MELSWMELPWGDAVARTPVNDSYPTHARELFDALEEKVGRLHPTRHAELQDDYVRDVPGASEPPD